jgi:hypothetical protein
MADINDVVWTGNTAATHDATVTQAELDVASEESTNQLRVSGGRWYDQPAHAAMLPTTVIVDVTRVWTGGVGISSVGWFGWFGCCLTMSTTGQLIY